MLIGYADTLSALAGAEIVVRVSTDAPTFDAELVRLIDRATAPGVPRDLRVEPIGSVSRAHATGQIQETRCGSFGWAPADAWLTRGTFAAWVWLMATTPGRLQGLIAQRDATTGAGVALVLDERTRPCLLAGSSRIVASAPLPIRAWVLVAGAFDLEAGEMRLLIAPREDSPHPHEDVAGRAEVSPAGAPAPLLVAAAAHRADASHFPRVEGLLNGKLERPVILPDPVATIDGINVTPARHAWDLGVDPDGELAPDLGSGARDLRLVNAPTRAMSGHRFTGCRLEAAAAPDEFGAIHFHDDDLDDACWERSVTLRLPDDLCSGIYAVRLDSGDDVDHVVVIVPHDRRRRGKPRAEVAYLVSTLTHLAYANARGNTGVERPPARSPLHTLLDEHPEWGSSTYDLHPDGSGISLSSARRPIVGLRPDYWSRARDEPAYFGEEMTLIGWLERTGVPYDVLCDHDLHVGGIGALDGYRVLVTSPHPEYWSEAMLDAVTGFQRRGGSLMYLGGNGFYWVTAVSPSRPHLIELRRGHSGGRAWTGEPGEGYHASTGEPGGLWRNRGRAPQVLAGVGFTAVGTGPWPGYRRLSASQDPRVAFMFGGLEHVPVGDEFLLGSAGNEIDRVDDALGTPPHAMRVASSEGLHDDHFLLDPADIPLLLAGIGLGSTDTRVRADLVFYETGFGSAVFSTGSIAWSEGMARDGYASDAARLTTNVLRRFVEPEPFTIPSEPNGDPS